MKKCKPIEHAIGLMSGTSADGIDGVLLDIPGDGDFRIAEYESLAYPADTAKKIRKITAQCIETADHSKGLDLELAVLYADVANKLASRAGNRPISVIGCHGQTVNHSPYSDPPFTLQLGNGKTLARLTGTAVVTDFRSADIAAGGQGAPLAPAFHQAMFASQEESRAVVNIGGISNITLLPQAREKSEVPGNVSGFDTGPGNTLIDYWCRSYFGCNYDNHGDIGRQGTPQLDLLDLLIRDDYFLKSPPKSTGLDYFNPAWLREKLGLWEGMDHCSKEDVLATLTALTARCISDQLNWLQPSIVSAYVCGGGSNNSLLLELIQLNCNAQIHDTRMLGIDPQWVEAAAFAWMGLRTLHGLTSTLPSVTGASKPTVAGIIHHPG
jgi:anhydro-N-acetylmuramic acid kinase